MSALFFPCISTSLSKRPSMGVSSFCSQLKASITGESTAFSVMSRCGYISSNYYKLKKSYLMPTLNPICNGRAGIQLTTIKTSISKRSEWKTCNNQQSFIVFFLGRNSCLGRGRNFLINRSACLWVYPQYPWVYTLREIPPCPLSSRFKI